MAEILCIRHGQASFDSDDYDQLSPLGYRQAEVLGEYLVKSKIEFTHVFSGTLSRQVQTAETVLSVFNKAERNTLDHVQDERWNELESEEQVEVLAPILAADRPEIAEYMKHARHDKKAFQKLIRATFDFWIENPQVTDKLETWQAAEQRVSEALESVRKKAGKGSLSGVFTSGGIIAIVTAHVLKLPSSAVYPLFEKVINASITRLLHNAEGVALSTFNEYSYLQAQADEGESNIVSYR